MKKDIIRKLPSKDLTGIRFGKLIVIRFDSYKEFGSTKKYKVGMWFVKCNCGVEKSVRQLSLISGDTKSCGCGLVEYRRTRLSKQITKINSKPKGEASFNELFTNYKYRSKKISVEFSLTKEEFGKMTKENCYYCGIEPIQCRKKRFRNGCYAHNGIDRLNSNKGYTIKNSVPCCEICNKAKRDMPFEDFINWIKRLSKHASKISFNYSINDREGWEKADSRGAYSILCKSEQSEQSNEYRDIPKSTLLLYQE